MFGEGQGLKKTEMAGCGCKVWGLEALRAVWRLCKEKGLKAYELDNSELQTVTRGAWYGRLWSRSCAELFGALSQRPLEGSDASNTELAFTVFP